MQHFSQVYTYLKNLYNITILVLGNFKNNSKNNISFKSNKIILMTNIYQRIVSILQVKYKFVFVVKIVSITFEQ